MVLNKSKGNMYKDISETWNPLGGKCYHDCLYCSTKSFVWPNAIKKYSGKIRLDANQLYKNLGTGKTIFVVGQNDLFAQNVGRAHQGDRGFRRFLHRVRRVSFQEQGG